MSRGYGRSPAVWRPFLAALVPDLSLSERELEQAIVLSRTRRGCRGDIHLVHDGNRAVTILAPARSVREPGQ